MALRGSVKAALGVVEVDGPLQKVFRTVVPTIGDMAEVQVGIVYGGKLVASSTDVPTEGRLGPGLDHHAWKH